MLNQFSDFLVENILRWLQSNIAPGHKYRFHSDDEENLISLVEAFERIKKGYITYHGTDLDYIEVNNTKLIFVNDVISIMTENYISNLRDAISGLDTELSKNALLILHKSRLDTLLTSGTDLAFTDGPLNASHIKDDLYRLIGETSSIPQFKAIMKLQTTIVEEERQSAFGYKTLYNSIITNNIKFKELSLLEDPDLFNESDDKRLEKRLMRNQELHDEIEDIMINFPSEIEERLSKRYSEDFINKKLTLDDWEDVTYNQLDQEIRRPRNTIDFENFECKNSEIILRNESSTAAGKRTKNVLIFCNDTELDIYVKFKGFNLTTDDFEIIDDKTSKSKTFKETAKLNYTALSKTLEVNNSFNGKPLYFTLKLKGNSTASTFTFKVLVVKKDAFVLDNIYNHFIIKPKTESILLQTSEFNINFSKEPNIEYQLSESETVNILENPNINYEHLYNTQNEVTFNISNGVDELAFSIEGKKYEEVISIPLLYNKDRLDKLFHKGVNAELNHKAQKAILEYQEIPLIAKRFTYIDLEYQMIDQELYSIGDPSKSLLELTNVEIQDTFKALLHCFKDKKTTPSLCAWDDKICSIATKFVNAVQNYLASIPNEVSLTSEQQQVMQIGKVYKDKREYFSPFSPLILSYILHLREKSNDNSFKDISQVTLERLNPKGLFPYQYKGANSYAYTTLVSDDPLWLEFVSNEESEFSYISKLATEKIIEFTKAFGNLFEFRHDAPLIINSINNTRNKELFKGLVEYYKKSFDSNPKQIIVNLYDQNFQETEFDIFADIDPYDTLISRYKLNKNAETIIDIMRTHITYSKHLVSEEKTYAHLTFFKNNEKVKIERNKVHNIKSGLVTSGLISGESSEENNSYYYSGFGLRNIDISDAKHLQMAKLYNALQRPAFENGAVYDKDETISLMISDNFKQLLKESYQSSLWTVIIDPKVTLDFFDNERDLILIHYSDQYSSSANYDAITVTAQKDIYAEVVGNENIIREFNAFNGEWLMKMIADKNEKNKREKKGIIAAYKYATAFVDKPGITWVPLSIAELLRVAGNVGLSMSQGDFSRYNEMSTNETLKGGAISDDILLVGYCDGNIVLHPVEVKSGRADVQKAIKQAKSLKSFFQNFLFKGNQIKAQLLKGLFIRQLFMQVEKFKLYDVFSNDYFNPLYENREKLFEGRYEIVNLSSYYDGAVVFFNDALSQLNTEFDTENKDNILVCKLPSSYQQEMLEKSYYELKQMLLDEKFGTDTRYMLQNVDCTTSPSAEKEKLLEYETPTIEDISSGTVKEVPQEENIVSRPSKEKQQLIGPMEITFGSNLLNNDKIIWYPTDTTKTLNTNTGIIGTMGTGKTQFTKSVVTQLVTNSQNNVEGSKIDMIIFDYKGDYIDDEFVTATNATVLKPFKLPFNPLSLFGSMDLLPIHTTNQFVTTISKVFGLGEVQKTRLDDVITEAYESKDIEPIDEDTWKNDAPTLHDIWEIYSSNDKLPIDSLYAALKKIQKFKIFEEDPSLTKPLFDMIDGVTVIKLSGYDPDIQNLIVAITLDLFYTQMHNRGSSKIDGDFRQITKMVLVDEADNFMSQEFESLKKILKEGREFGVGTILSTQQLTHFKTSEDNYADYIQTWIVHQVANIKLQDITSIFNLSDKKEAGDLMNQIRKLEKHYSVYVDGKKKMMKMRDLAFWELNNE